MNFWFKFFIQIELISKYYQIPQRLIFVNLPFHNLFKISPQIKQQAEDGSQHPLLQVSLWKSI